MYRITRARAIFTAILSAALLLTSCSAPLIELRAAEEPAPMAVNPLEEEAAEQVSEPPLPPDQPKEPDGVPEPEDSSPAPDPAPVPEPEPEPIPEPEPEPISEPEPEPIPEPEP